ncbi:MAG TPA: DUF4185 domain-containing protein [Puia sp.]|nr:DUF4185 domain-containing protein [Puia sp.]
MFKHSNILLSLAFALLSIGPVAAQNTVPPLPGTPVPIVDSAPQWSALFKRSSGWYGGDGIFTIPMGSGKTLFYFSDTMIGDSIGGKARSTMIHNSFAVLQGRVPSKDKIQFYWDTSHTGGPQTPFIPKTPSTQAGDYYWLGAGFFNPVKKATYIFAYKMRNLDPHDDWSFTLTHTNMIVIPAGSTPPFRDHRQIETPLSFQGASPDEKGTFGAGIFTDPDGYVYVYGIKGKAKSLLVARVRADSVEDFSGWRFWDGAAWNKDMQRSAAVTDGVSDELSLSPLPDGRYILVFQQNGMSPVISMRTGATPWGPFGAPTKLWECTEGRENKHYFTYNAKAHPLLSAPGELLISYNVNSFDFFKEIQKNPNLYRPRFIRLKL